MMLFGERRIAHGKLVTGGIYPMLVLLLALCAAPECTEATKSLKQAKHPPKDNVSDTDDPILFVPIDHVPVDPVEPISLTPVDPEQLACKCSDSYAPVCAENERFYINLCQARCEGEIEDDVVYGVCPLATPTCAVRCPQPTGEDPVCADGRDYPSQCSALCSNANIILDGECPEPCEGCNEVYEPVCAGNNIFFPNACQARCAGYSGHYIKSGICALPPPPPTCASQCLGQSQQSCPVCGDGVTYSSTCEALCSGALMVQSEACPAREPRCKSQYDPVCAGGETFDNPCLARLAGHRQYSEGQCDERSDGCLCTAEVLPVCYNGETYNNECEAKCEGANDGNIMEGDCRSACRCSSNYAPVCYQHRTFRNWCLAKCAGGIASTITKGKCPEEEVQGCLCTQEYRPVCSGGETYQNACSAQCAGALKLDIEQGECEELEVEQCVCTKEHEPVCYEGKTFGNMCLAGCEGATTVGVTMGACHESRGTAERNEPVSDQASTDSASASAYTRTRFGSNRFSGNGWRSTSSWHSVTAGARASASSFADED